MTSRKVEVTGVSRATESHTGKQIFLVQFGEKVTVDEELQKYLPSPQGSKPAKTLFANIMQIFFDSDKAAPYKVGSKWDLEIAENGKVTLTEVK